MDNTIPNRYEIGSSPYNTLQQVIAVLDALTTALDKISRSQQFNKMMAAVLSAIIPALIGLRQVASQPSSRFYPQKKNSNIKNLNIFFK